MSGVSILFVDDDPLVLEGLSNLLRKQRKRWHMTFALGAQAALDELGKGTYDVVVSDMRMPGMDGAALLRRVKEDHPGTTRIILSGHAERASVVASLPVAHQFLSKPSNGEALTRVIERTRALQARLHDQRVCGAIARLGTPLPAPVAYLELLQAAADPVASHAELARILARDPAAADELLRLANAGFRAGARPLVSLTEAAAELGAGPLKALALHVHVFGMRAEVPLPDWSWPRVQQQALLCARLAARFVEGEGRAEEALMAGLLKDAGTVVLSRAMPRELAQLVQATRASGRAPHEVEQELLGLTRADVGAHLLGAWGIPFPVLEAVACHARPVLVPEGPREVLAAVHVAAAWVEALERGATIGGEHGLDARFLEQAGATPRLGAWRSLAEPELRAAAGAVPGAGPRAEGAR